MKWLFAMLLCLNAICSAAAQETKPLLRGSYQNIISAHAGKPFIIALWSLDCTHCRDDLALLGKLHARYRTLDVVLVATDTPSQQSEIQTVLEHYALQRSESWVFADSYVERLRFEIDTQWYGELPRTYFFDAQGHGSAVSGKLDRGQIERWIRSSRKRG
ncbi:MAG: TlpA disulfide reductase family protein [Gallionella sp.]